MPMYEGPQRTNLLVVQRESWVSPFREDELKTKNTHLNSAS
jgi:hypothetical protein